MSNLSERIRLDISMLDYLFLILIFFRALLARHSKTKCVKANPNQMKRKWSPLFTKNDTQCIIIIDYEKNND